MIDLAPLRASADPFGTFSAGGWAFQDDEFSLAAP